MSDARRYAIWPDPRSRSRSLKGSRPSVPHGTNFFYNVNGTSHILPILLLCISMHNLSSVCIVSKRMYVLLTFFHCLVVEPAL